MEAESTVEPVHNPSEMRKKKRFVYGAAFFLLTIALIALLWWLFQRPSQGTITVVSAPELIDRSEPKSREHYQGKYLTFTYPDDFRRREEVEVVKYPLLERVYLSRNDIEGRKIALTLQDNAGNSFEEYSSFRIRRSDPTVYTEDRTERNGLDAVFFTKMNSVFEVSAFFYRGSQVVVIVVSSPTTQSGLREELEAILDSFEWKGE